VPQKGLQHQGVFFCEGSFFFSFRLMHSRKKIMAFGKNYCFHGRNRFLQTSQCISINESYF
jgi:hypothetical protein